jgi:hypothetical protein
MGRRALVTAEIVRAALANGEIRSQIDLALALGVRRQALIGAIQKSHDWLQILTDALPTSTLASDAVRKTRIGTSAAPVMLTLRLLTGAVENLSSSSGAFWLAV